MFFVIFLIYSLDGSFTRASFAVSGRKEIKFSQGVFHVLRQGEKLKTLQIKTINKGNLEGINKVTAPKHQKGVPPVLPEGNLFLV